MKDIGDRAIHCNRAECIIKNGFIHRHIHNADILFSFGIQGTGNHILISSERIRRICTLRKPDNPSFFGNNLLPVAVYIIYNTYIGGPRMYHSALYFDLHGGHFGIGIADIAHFQPDLFPVLIGDPLLRQNIYRIVMIQCHGQITVLVIGSIQLFLG